MKVAVSVHSYGFIVKAESGARLIVGIKHLFYTAAFSYDVYPLNIMFRYPFFFIDFVSFLSLNFKVFNKNSICICKA